MNSMTSFSIYYLVNLCHTSVWMSFMKMMT
ncbi:hypothetical protein Hypma_005996 [Hypsizygus marmoreus]|uniref:Uncharacterized protein n=1 Tax=Hypsizygus marmoreus TaxID=39966 RepID=A0A369KG34_HYPMA|nr:hypothetical protein Hypma_005996 [Hypsizygus marmoreus]